MTDRDEFWVEPGCAPSMDRDQTEAYLSQLEAAYLKRGDHVFGEAYVNHVRSTLNPPRPGPDEAAIGAWECEHGVRLPAILRHALQVQDGGYVRGTLLQVHDLSEMEPLSGDTYAHMWDYQDNRDFGDPFKLHRVGGDGTSGGILILDYNTRPEPRVLWLWRDLGDELRDEGDGTFDQMIVRQRDVTAGPQRDARGKVRNA
jgi:hypothetical protein